MIECELCNKIINSNLKRHQTSKACIKIRNQKEHENKKVKLTCNGCNMVLSNKQSFENHKLKCLSYQLLLKDQEYQKRIKEKEDEKNRIIELYKERIKEKENEINRMFELYKKQTRPLEEDNKKEILKIVEVHTEKLEKKENFIEIGLQNNDMKEESFELQIKEKLIELMINPSFVTLMTNFIQNGKYLCIIY